MTAIEFTDEEILRMAQGWRFPDTIRDKFIAALPVESCGHRVTDCDCGIGCFEESPA